MDHCVVLLVTYVFVQGIYFRSKLEIFKFAKTSLLPLEMNPIVDPAVYALVLAIEL